MVFTHPGLISRPGRFKIDREVTARAHACLTDRVFAEFWNGFTFHTSSLTVEDCTTLVFSIGDALPLPLDGNAYAIRVTPTGVCISADSQTDLVHGFMTLLDRIRLEDSDEGEALWIDCFDLKESPLIEKRMVHYCVFPETELWELKRFIRFAAALKYTHLIIEFWGMLRYDCMKELAWEHAYQKEELRPLFAEARALGLELIPMFNHWGHASASRVMHGKHVVLDQNPTLQYLFSDNGWCWDIRSARVRALLGEIRRELIELCGDGDYFHIGCDEAYGFDMTKKEARDALCAYVNEISAELKRQGRRAIAWGDMFLCKRSSYNPKNAYVCNAPTPEAEADMLARLSRDVIIADWQYDATEAPVETAFVFRDAGFDTLLCPWDRAVDKLNSCLSTVKDARLYGLLHTTWHTLSKGMPYVMLAALGGFESIEGIRASRVASKAASLLRKVYFADGDYEKSGWAKSQIRIPY